MLQNISVLLKLFYYILSLTLCEQYTQLYVLGDISWHTNIFIIIQDSWHKNIFKVLLKTQD